MRFHHLRLASGSIAIVFLCSSVLASNVYTAADKSRTALSTEDKRIIMGAQQLKKRKKAEAQEKADSMNKEETTSQQKKKERGTDER